MNVPEELLPLIAWWEKDGKKTVAYAGAAAVVGLAIWGFKARREHLADLAHAAELTPVMSVDAAREQLDAHGQDNPVFRLKLASAYFNRAETDDFAAALEIYESLAKTDALPSALRDLPRLGRAECLEALGRCDEAQQVYRELLADEPAGGTALNARLGLARTLGAAGRRDEALELLDEYGKTVAEADHLVRLRIEQCRNCVAKALKEPAAGIPAPAAVSETPANIDAAPAVPAAEAAASAAQPQA